MKGVVLLREPKIHHLIQVEKQKPAGLLRIYAEIRKEALHKKFAGTVRARFLQVSKDMEDEVQELYPITVQMLYQAAKRVLHGDLGAQLEMLARANDERILEPDAIFTFLLFETHQEERLSEIFQSHKGSVELARVLERIDRIDSMEIEPLLLHKSELLHRFFQQLRVPKSLFYPLRQIFQTYLGNLTHPSHLTVEMQLNGEADFEDSIRTAMKLKNRKEKRRSILQILQKLLSQKLFKKAVRFVKRIQARKISKPPYQFLIETLFPHGSNGDSPLQMEHVDESILLAKSISEPREREKMLKNLALGVTKNGDVEKGLQIVNEIKSRESREYVLSSIVQLLSHRRKFDYAKKITSTIRNQDFRQDAIAYIIKAYLERDQLHEVMKYIDTIKNEKDKIAAAKLLLQHASVLQIKSFDC